MQYRPLPSDTDDLADAFTRHASLCEMYKEEDFPSETWGRVCQLQHQAAPHYRELSRILHAVAAQMEKLADECREAGVWCPIASDQANEQND